MSQAPRLYPADRFMDLLAVYTTVANESQAAELAIAAIDQGLAACVQVEPIRSTYRWNGKLNCDPEVRLLLKTTKATYQALERFLLDHHPYEVPAIFAIPVTKASAGYASWVCKSVAAP